MPLRVATARAVRRLPVSLDRWEIVLVPPPDAFEHLDLEGLLLVFEMTTGHARNAEALRRGKPLWSALGNALVRPQRPLAPARPRVLVCRDQALADRLRAELEGLGIAVEIEAGSPVVEAAVNSVRGQLAAAAAPTAPGVTNRTSEWLAVLRELCRLAPWRRVSDGVLFRFGTAVPELADAIGVLLGQMGEQRGIALYASQASFDAFLQAIDRAPFPEMSAVKSWCLYLDPEGEFDPDEVEACVAAGLALPGGLFPRAAAVWNGSGRALDDREQVVVLAAVQAVTALCGASLSQVEETACAMSVRTVLGEIVVSSAPPANDELVASFVGADHTLRLGGVRVGDATEVRPAVVLNLAKRAASRLARRLDVVDGVRIATAGRRSVLRALNAGRDVGVLAVLDEDGQSFLDEIAQRREVMVCVAAGGALRGAERDEPFLAARSLPVC